MESRSDLYTLYSVNEASEEEIVLFDLGREEGLGQIMGMAVYTTPDGQSQREHLAKFSAPDAGLLVVYPITCEELLAALNQHAPTSVLLDGRKIAGSVLKGMLKNWGCL